MITLHRLTDSPQGLHVWEEIHGGELELGDEKVARVINCTSAIGPIASARHQEERFCNQCFDYEIWRKGGENIEDCLGRGGQVSGKVFVLDRASATKYIIGKLRLFRSAEERQDYIKYLRGRHLLNPAFT